MTTAGEERHLYTVLTIGNEQGDAIVAYALDTRYGNLILVFASEGELPRFEAYAAATLKPGYKIQRTGILAESFSDVGPALERERLIPAPRAALVLEGTPFFEQVIRELEEDTIWPES